jgi:hypothetical protein
MGRSVLNAGRKAKRAIRRRNRIAHTLADDKYHQRITEKKKEVKPSADEWRDDNGDFS